MANLKRKNIQMSEEIAKWYEDKAEEMGVSQSALMTMALAQYKDSQEALEFTSQLPIWLKQIEQISDKNKLDKGSKNICSEVV